MSDKTPADLIGTLEEDLDGKVFKLIRHRKYKHDLADWKQNPSEYDFAFHEVMDAIDWRRATMTKTEFKQAIDEIIESRADAEETGPTLHELTPFQFRMEYNWNKLKVSQIAERCHQWLSRQDVVVYSNEQIWCYNNGVWETDDSKLKAKLAELLGGHFSTGVTKELKENYITVQPAYSVDWSDMGISGTKVAVENGLLDIRKREIIRELQPDDYAISRIPVEWKGPDAKRGEWEQFIAESVEANKRNALQEYAGVTLRSNEYRCKKALMLLGDGDNGKSVFTDVIGWMLGDENTTGMSLQQLAGNRFGGQRLVGSLANINGDIGSKKLEEVASFKQLTGGDRIQVEEKYETPIDITNTAKMIFAANKVPKVEVTDDLAFFRRWVFVQLPKRFTELDDQYPDADKEMKYRIKENELPGVLAWAVEGLNRYLDNECFTGQESGRQLRSDWMNYADETSVFVRNYIEKCDTVDDRLTVDELYSLYETFIEQTPTNPTTKQTLHRYITNRYPDAETKQWRDQRDHGDNVNKRFWTGVTIAPNNRQEIRTG